MEYIVFCDKANKAYETRRGSVCPACGEAWGDTLNHVVMRVSLGTDRHARCYLFRAFLGACKATKSNHNAVRAVVGDASPRV